MTWDDRDSVIVRDACHDDCADIGRLFVGMDRGVLEPAFGTEDAVGEYIRRTFHRDGLFCKGTVRVAERDGAVVGLCICYARVANDVATAADAGMVAGDGGLAVGFDDAVESQEFDIREATAMGFAYLDSLSVDPKARGTGVGRVLLEDALSRHERIMLYVADDNEVAIGLYEHEGFRKYGLVFGVSEDGGGIDQMMLIMANAPIGG